MVNNDITQTGALTFDALQDLNNEDFVKQFNNDPEFAKWYSSVAFPVQTSVDFAMQAPTEYEYDDSRVAPGKSRWDPNRALSLYELEHLEDIRGHNQGAISKLANSIGKGVITTGTTFVDGTLGAILGTTEALITGEMSKLWDNEITRAMKEVSDWQEKNLANYYTEEENEREWYKNITTANFWGDKFIKNLGFTVGSVASQAGLGAIGAITKVGKLGQAIQAVGNINRNVTRFTKGVVGSLMAAENEGAIEALNGAIEFKDQQLANLEQMHNQQLEQLESPEMQEQLLNELGYSLQDIENLYNTPSLVVGPDGSMYNSNLKKLEEIQQQLQQLKAQKAVELQQSYTAAIEKIETDAVKMGNSVMAMNIPVLAASNMIMYGRLFGRGFSTARLTSYVRERGGEFVNSATRGKALLHATKDAMSEGLEEASQSAIVNVSSDYFGTDIMNFYKHSLDPQAEQDTMNWINSAYKGIAQTLQDPGTQEEAFIGFLTGAIGLPAFKRTQTSKTNKKGNYKTKIGMSWESGYIGAMREYRKDKDRADVVVDYINNRLQDKQGFINYYRGLTRHTSLQNLMDDATARGDKFDYKNAEEAQLISDIIMFDSAGKLDYLKKLIKEASGKEISTSDLNSIVKNTSKVDAEDHIVGPWAEYAKMNEDGTISVIEDEFRLQEMKKEIQQKNKQLLQQIDLYKKLQRETDVESGGRFTDDELTEITYLRQQILNWQSRRDDLVKGTDFILRPFLNRLDHINDEKDPYYSPELKKAFETLRKSLKRHNVNLLKHLDKLSESDPHSSGYRKIVKILADIGSQDVINAFHNILAVLYKDRLTDDVIAQSEGNTETQSSFVEFLERFDDSIKLLQFAEQYQEKVQEYLGNPNTYREQRNKEKEKAENKKKTEETKDLETLLSKAQTIKEIKEILNNSDFENIGGILNKLAEDNPLCKEYLQMLQFQLAVEEKILNSNNPLADKIEEFFIKHCEESNSLKEIQDVKSPILTDMNVFKRIVGREITNDEYSDAYRLIKHCMSNITDSLKKGNTINPIETPQAPTGTPQAPTGTSGQLSYYRPAIPEYDIEASKRGDYRTFAEVKKGEGLNFDAIYNFLVKYDAFKYVNEGRLKKGDKVYFAICPKLNDHTVCMVVKRRVGDKEYWQIIGTLDEGEKSVAKFAGLKALNERIRKYEKDHANERQTKNSLLVDPTVYVTVTDIKLGTIQFSDHEINLSVIRQRIQDTNPLFDKDKTLVFGYTSGGIITSPTVDSSLIEQPVDPAPNGFYWLVPNARGTYSPISLRVKTFGVDDQVDHTLIDTIINNGITPNATKQQIKEMMQKLGEIIYLGEVLCTVQTTHTGGLQLLVGIREKDQNGNFVRNKNNTFKYKNITIPISGQDISDVRKKFLDVLYSYKLPFQIDRKKMGNENYMMGKVLGDMLTTNVSDPNMRSCWFTTTTYLDTEGSSTQAPPVAPVSPVSPIGGEEQQQNANNDNGKIPVVPKESAKATKNPFAASKPPLKHVKRLRETTTARTKVGDLQKELAWLSRVLPQLSSENRIRIVKGLIQVGEHGRTAFGQYFNSIITLSDQAAEGTVYHEAFHAVLDLFLSEEEKADLFKEAAAYYKSDDVDYLEEQLAEEFREYTQTKVEKTWWGKIKDFFKTLFGITSNAEKLMPHFYALAKQINDGQFAQESLQEQAKINLESMVESEEMNNILQHAPKTELGLFILSDGTPCWIQNKKLYALTRTTAFKKWFGDWETSPKTASIMTCPTGEPAVFYEKATLANGGKLLTSNAAEAISTERVYFINSKNPTIKSSELNKEGDEGILITEEESGTNNVIIYDTNRLLTISTPKPKYKLTEDGYILDSKENQELKERIATFLAPFGISLEKITSLEEVGVTLDNLIKGIVGLRDNINNPKVFKGLAALINVSPAAQRLMTAKYSRTSTKVRTILNGGKLSSKDINNLATLLQSAFSDFASFIASENGSERFELLEEFLSKINPAVKNRASILQRILYGLAGDVILGDAPILRNKEVESGKKILVDIESALEDFPWEAQLIRDLGELGFSLGGSTSIAMDEKLKLYRKKENPFHDIDVAVSPQLLHEKRGKRFDRLTPEQVKEVLSLLQKKGYYIRFDYNNIVSPTLVSSTHIIASVPVTLKEKYPIVNSAFRTMQEMYKKHRRSLSFLKKLKPIRGYYIYSNGVKIGESLGNEITLTSEAEAKGIKVIALDIFETVSSVQRGEDTLDKEIIIKGKKYLIADAKNALQAKLEWKRNKDVYDMLYLHAPSKIKVNDSNLKQAWEKAKIAYIQDSSIISKLHGKHIILEEALEEKIKVFLSDNLGIKHSQKAEIQFKAGTAYSTWLQTQIQELSKEAQATGQKVIISDFTNAKAVLTDIDLCVRSTRDSYVKQNEDRADSKRLNAEVDYMNAVLGFKAAHKTITINPSSSTIITGNKWQTLSQETQELLSAKGISEEEFNKMSQDEQDYFLNCARFN